MGSRTRRRWLIFAILGAFAAGLGDVAPPPSSLTTGKRMQNEIETSTIAITSLRMYHLDSPPRRRFLSASQPSSTLTVGNIDNTASTIVQEPTLRDDKSRLNSIKENEVLNWLHGLSRERKRLFLDKIGCTPCTCSRNCNHRKCKKIGHLTPESRNLKPPPPPLPESEISITTTSTTSSPPPSTIATPEPTTARSTTITTSTTTTTLQPTTTTTTTTELPLGSSTPKLTEPMPTPKSIDYSSVPTSKKKSKCRRKKKSGKGAN